MWPGAAVAVICRKPPISREFWPAADVGRDALLEHQPAVETRRLAVGEQIGGQIEIGVAGGEHRRREPGHVEPRQLDAILEHDA